MISPVKLHYMPFFGAKTERFDYAGQMRKEFRRLLCLVLSCVDKSHPVNAYRMICLSQVLDNDGIPSTGSFYSIFYVLARFQKSLLKLGSDTLCPGRIKAMP